MACQDVVSAALRLGGMCKAPGLQAKTSAAQSDVRALAPPQAISSKRKRRDRLITARCFRGGRSLARA